MRPLKRKNNNSPQLPSLDSLPRGPLLDIRGPLLDIHGPLLDIHGLLLEPRVILGPLDQDILGPRVGQVTATAIADIN